jgi:hypothetical protein
MTTKEIPDALWGQDRATGAGGLPDKARDSVTEAMNSHGLPE